MLNWEILLQETLPCAGVHWERGINCISHITTKWINSSRVLKLQFTAHPTKRRQLRWSSKHICTCWMSFPFMGKNTWDSLFGVFFLTRFTTHSSHAWTFPFLVIHCEAQLFIHVIHSNVHLRHVRAKNYKYIYIINNLQFIADTKSWTCFNFYQDYSWF